MARPSLFALAPLGALLVAAPARSATYDPDLTWRTLRTDHFHIHFHQGEEQLAEEFSQTVEEIYDTMTAEMKWKPRRRTHVVLIDRTDTANGFAGSVPYNAITIFVTGPTEDSTLGLYEDWLTGIQTHEFTHTLHIDSTHFPASAARWVVGRIASTNRLSPKWMVEGLATFQETRHSNAGRGRTALVDMIVRTAALEDDIPALGRMDGFQARPPGGQLRYLFGRHFMQYVADNHGPEVWTRWVHTYGSSVPYLLPGRFVLGGPLESLHRTWKAELSRQAYATVRQLEEEGPISRARLITDPKKSCFAPTFSPDGETLIWSCSDPQLGSQLWTSDGAGFAPELLVQDRGARTFAWRADSKAVAYAGSHIVNRFNVWSDLYLLDLQTKRVSTLTSGARARDPDFSPDGQRLVMVSNRAQNNQLEVKTVDRQQKALTRFTDHTQIGTPRHSPDGKVLAASVWRDGRRDLWLIGTDGTFLRRLTLDDAIDRDPRWSADGRTLYFASDRTGIPQIFAIDVASERLWQVTNVPTGAVAPSPHPSGERIAWQEYHSRGWRIAVADLDRSQWIDRGVLPRPLRHGAPIASLTGPVQAPAIASSEVPTWESPAPAPRRRRFGVPIDPVAADLPGAAVHLPVQLPGALPDAAFRQDGGGIDSFDQADVEGVFGEEEDFPFTIEPRRYTPLGPLLPRYWVPFVQTTLFPSRKPFGALPLGLFASASTGSVDPLRHYAWGAALTYGTDSGFVGGAATFTLNRWIPVYSMSVGRSASVASPIFKVDPETPTDENGDANLIRDGWYWQKRHTASVSVNYPYTFKTFVFARYGITFLDNLDPIPSDAVEELLPLRGAIGSVQGGWRYAWNQQTNTAISTEDGRIVSLVGGLILPFLGSYSLEPDGGRRGLTAVQLTAELREYRVLPWSKNHVLAVRLAGGAALGSDRRLGLYQLGGNFGEGAFYVTPSSSRMVRGFPIGADVGDAYWLGSVEYRLPIYRFDHGISTLPVFVRALSAHAFVDTGNAFDTPQSWRDPFADPLLGAGAELRLSTVLWYGVGATGRLGVATGLSGPNRITLNNPKLAYFRVGGSF